MAPSPSTPRPGGKARTANSAAVWCSQVPGMATKVWQLSYRALWCCSQRDLKNTNAGDDSRKETSVFWQGNTYGYKSQESVPHRSQSSVVPVVNTDLSKTLQITSVSFLHQIFQNTEVLTRGRNEWPVQSYLSVLFSRALKSARGRLCRESSVPSGDKSFPAQLLPFISGDSLSRCHWGKSALQVYFQILLP